MATNLANLALLFDITVYTVDNGIRRGTLKLAANVQSTDNEIAERSKTIDPGDTWEFDCLTVNKGTVIRSQNGPVQAQFTKGLETWTRTITSVYIDTDQLDSIVFSNPVEATQPVFVRVIQA